MKNFLLITCFCVPFIFKAQNPLFIPTSIEGNSINLTLAESSYEFYGGTITNTMGANGDVLAPTIIMNQGQNVDITVNNQLMDTTTIHWHGLHVSPANDGGPHNEILPGGQWNPQFTVLDKAGTYWYHPHLHMKTDLHVSKGIAGMLLVRDAEEASLNLPTTYGVDEFPLIMQTKGFDANNQILVHTDLDNIPMVNATVNAVLDVPAQVVRLRLLNGASQRVMEVGFSDDRTFELIGTDGGLLTAPVSLTRYRMAPGQRADILVDLSGQENTNFYLMSFASELPSAIYGATQPGMGPGSTSSLPDYTSNILNGNDFSLMKFMVVGQTANPITTIPSSLANIEILQESSANTTRTLTFSSSGAMGNLAGPFLINGQGFNMDVINYEVPLNNTEIWSLNNQTAIAHPFHIHDVQFQILDINGAAPPPALQGWNDMVLVPGGMGNVRFIAQFTDHADNDIPYMYHCHMLTHEDMGMMGQFKVIDPTGALNTPNEELTWSVFHDSQQNTVTIKTYEPMNYEIIGVDGHSIWQGHVDFNKTIFLKSSSTIIIVRDGYGNAEKLLLN